MYRVLTTLSFHQGLRGTRFGPRVLAWTLGGFTTFALQSSLRGRCSTGFGCRERSIVLACFRNNCRHPQERFEAKSRRWDVGRIAGRVTHQSGAFAFASLVSGRDLQHFAFHIQWDSGEGFSPVSRKYTLSLDVGNG